MIRWKFILQYCTQSHPAGFYICANVLNGPAASIFRVEEFFFLSNKWNANITFSLMDTLHPKFRATRGTRIYFVYHCLAEHPEYSNDNITVNNSDSWVIYEYAWVGKQQLYYDNNIVFTSRIMSMPYSISRYSCFCFVDTYRFIKYSLCTWRLQYKILMIWRWPSLITLVMWTVLYWTQSSRTQFGVSINVWKLAVDTLNITCSFLYCNHQVHRDFLITLYYTVRRDLHRQQWGNCETPHYWHTAIVTRH